MTGTRLDLRDFVPMLPEDVEGSLTARFARQVQDHGGRIAVKYDDEALTYEELDRRSSRIANALLARCGREPEPVVLLLEQGVTLVASILGILKAGKFYVPLDPTHPVPRLLEAAEESEASAVLTDVHNLARAHALGSDSRAVLEVGALAEGASTRDPALPLTPDALAYVFFTSGSTGRPKGVVDAHRNVLHNVLRYTNNLRIGPDDRLTLLQSASFSGTVSSLFGALLNGATVLPYDLRRDGLGSGLASWAFRERITIYHSVPSIFRSFLEGSASFPDVRIVRLEGDAATLTDVELHQKHFPHSVLAIGLGATETGLSCQLLVDRDSTPIEGVVPVGFPTSDMRLSVHDPERRPVAPGHAGELAVTSPYLAVGYWKSPDRTAAAFTSAADGGPGRTYLTGDLARIRPDGCVEFLGRKDHRLKVSGQTVEAADVETALVRTGLVREAAVTTREAAGESCLVAHVVPSARQPFCARAVRAMMARSVPDSMVPRAFVVHAKLPVTTNGKVDRSALRPPPSRGSTTSNDVRRVARDYLEKTLTGVWATTLGVAAVGIDEDFRDLGGDSLLAARASIAIERRVGRKVPADAVLAHGTVEKLALAIRRGLGLPPASAIVPLRTEGARRPFFFVNVPFRGPAQFTPLSAQLGSDRPFYVIRPVDGVDVANDGLRFESLAARRISEVAAIQPHGPYLLGGWCYGAVVAFEMARQLRAAGEKVALLALCQITAFDFPSLVSPLAHWRYRAHQTVGRHLVHAAARLSLHRRQSLEHAGGRVSYVKDVLARACQRTAARAREPRGPAPVRIEEHAFQTYAPRRWSDDVLLVLSEEETRPYAHDPEAAWRGLADGRVAVDVVKGDPAMLFEAPQVLELGAILGRELARVEAG